MTGRHRSAAGTAPARIQAQELVLGYAGEPVLSGLDLAVPAGAMLAVTGPSGVGKTTLVRALCGQLAPRSGRVLLDDSPMTSFATALEAGVVVVPEGNELVAVLTAQENVALPLLTRGDPRPSRPDVLAVMESVGVGDVADQLIDELSGGEQQRVAVARALAQSPAVLLADEPTSELDATTRGRVLDALRSCAGAGAAVLMTTHDPQAAEVCDAEIHLLDGRAQWRRAW